MSTALKLNKYYEFVRWLAKPEPLKRQDNDPLTQKELAAEWGVHEVTLCNWASGWRHDPNFRDDLKREIERWAVEKTPNVVAALYGKSLKGDPFAIKLWLQYFEGFTEKSEQKVSGEVRQIVEVSVEKRELIVNAFANFGILKEPKQNDSNDANTDAGTGAGNNQPAGSTA